MVDHSLKALDESMRKLDSRLILEAGVNHAVLEFLLEKYQARAVFWNDLYEPALLPGMMQ